MNEALGVMLLGRDHFHRHKNQKKSVGPDANFGHKNFVLLSSYDFVRTQLHAFLYLLAIFVT